MKILNLLISRKTWERHSITVYIHVNLLHTMQHSSKILDLVNLSLVNLYSATMGSAGNQWDQKAPKLFVPTY